MFKVRFIKLLIFLCAVTLLAKSASALPDYLKIYDADPFAKAELKGKCSVCHLNPAGGGARNDFGRAFAQAGHRITPALRQQFPNHFTSGQQTPPVTFTSDNEAVVEINGKRYAINTRDKSVKELAAAPAQAAPKPEPTAVAQDRPNVYRPIDVRVISLPSTVPIPKGSLWTDFTHRFPNGDPTDVAGAFGLDTIAYPSFGVVYGVTDRIHVGAYRSPGNLGRAIQVYAGAQLAQESKGHPLNFQARVGLEGRDNFQRNFSTSFEFALARSLTRHAQIYFSPTITVGDRPFTVVPAQNEAGKTAVAIGGGVAVNIRPSVALMAEVNGRINGAARYQTDFGTGMHHPAFSFAIQKASATRRHGFTLVFSNSPGTTMAQRSMTRGLFGRDDGFEGLTIGFNIVRRIF